VALVGRKKPELGQVLTPFNGSTMTCSLNGWALFCRHVVWRLVSQKTTQNPVKAYFSFFIFLWSEK